MTGPYLLRVCFVGEYKSKTFISAILWIEAALDQWANQVDLTQWPLMSWPIRCPYPSDHQCPDQSQPSLLWPLVSWPMRSLAWPTDQWRRWPVVSVRTPAGTFSRDGAARSAQPGSTQAGTHTNAQKYKHTWQNVESDLVCFVHIVYRHLLPKHLISVLLGSIFLPRYWEVVKKRIF